MRREFAMPLWSDRLGLIGRADLVEFGPTAPYPVEYKLADAVSWGHEAIQLCAQAICLEEMLGNRFPAGAIYYHGSRARREVDFDAALRELVEDTATSIRAMIDPGSYRPNRRCALPPVLASRPVPA